MKGGEEAGRERNMEREEEREREQERRDRQRQLEKLRGWGKEKEGKKSNFVTISTLSQLREITIYSDTTVLNINDKRSW